MRCHLSIHYREFAGAVYLALLMTTVPRPAHRHHGRSAPLQSLAAAESKAPTGDSWLCDSWQGVPESFAEGHLAVSHGGCIKGACLGGKIRLPGKSARPRGHGDPLSLFVIHWILRCQLDLLLMRGMEGKESRDALTRLARYISNCCKGRMAPRQFI